MAFTAIDDPEAYFQTKLYTGTGSSAAQTFDGDTDMQPDMVWIKQRSGTEQHVIFDAVRGVQKYVTPNTTAAEGDTATTLTAFGSDGFTEGGHGITGQSSNTYVAWCWKESATSGVDIVSYTGNGTDDTDISHNLSAVPRLILVKNRDAADAWQVYHGTNTAAPETDYLVLNTTAATADDPGRWSDEAPTSSVFTLGTDVTVNTDTENYITYCFADVQGFSKFGAYVGHGNADGTFVFLGFRPAWVMIKGTGGTTNWHIYDDQRLGLNNIDNNSQRANLATADQTDDDIFLLSNGFKIKRNTSALNTAGGTYVYAAFAKAPFVNSNGVPCNAK